jgi:hypothetical protein
MHTMAPLARSLDGERAGAPSTSETRHRHLGHRLGKRSVTMTMDLNNSTAPKPPPVGSAPLDDDEPGAPRALSVDALPYLRGPVKVRREINRGALAWGGGLLALVLVLASAAWGITQRDAADEAREQAKIWQSELGSLVEERSTAQTDLDKAQDRLTSLDAEVVMLRDQLTRLNGELAQASTANALGATERETLREMARRGPVVAAEVQRCADARADVASRALALVGVDPNAPRTALDAAVVTANDVCPQAQQSLTDLQRSIETLDQPPAPQ